MKNLKDLSGVKTLSKTEQKSINGGFMQCDSQHLCVYPYCCETVGPLAGTCQRTCA